VGLHQTFGETVPLFSLPRFENLDGTYKAKGVPPYQTEETKAGSFDDNEIAPARYQRAGCFYLGCGSNDGKSL